MFINIVTYLDESILPSILNLADQSSHLPHPPLSLTSPASYFNTLDKAFEAIAFQNSINRLRGVRKVRLRISFVINSKLEA